MNGDVGMHHANNCRMRSSLGSTIKEAFWIVLLKENSLCVYMCVCACIGRSLAHTYMYVLQYSSNMRCYILDIPIVWMNLLALSVVNHV